MLGDEPRHAVGLGTWILNDKASWSTHERIEPLTQSSPCEGYHSREQLKALEGGVWKTRIAEPEPSKGYLRCYGDEAARKVV